MTLAELRHLAEQLPDGAALTLPKALLLEVVAAVVATTTHTVASLAGVLHRSPSTMRGWLEAGYFPGAYKLPGNPHHTAWRIPQAAVEAFLARQRPPAAPPGVQPSAKPASPRSARRPKGDPVDLGAWRAVR